MPTDRAAIDRAILAEIHILGGASRQHLADRLSLTLHQVQWSLLRQGSVVWVEGGRYRLRVRQGGQDVEGVA